MKALRLALCCALPWLFAMPSTGRADGMRMAAPKACSLPPMQAEAMLRANYEAFDQAMTGDTSWRPLVDEGCYDTAAGIVGDYLARNSASLTAEQMWTMNFHVGQALAMGGRDEASIVWFEKARDPHAGTEWLSYVDATLAFLRKDAQALATARAAYATAAGRDPARLHVIEGFRACLTKTYMEALMCMPG